MTDYPRLGAFTLREVIGDGAMARVYGGVHDSGVPVAIKVLSAPASAPAYALSFRNEIEAVARLTHPGIVTVYDFGEISAELCEADEELSPGSPYIAMELAQAGTLEGIGVLAWPDLRDCLKQLLEALAHAHARGVIHRDIKPGNVLVDGSGDRRRYMLTDFGLAAALDDDESTSHASWASSGTPPFMAPEQFRGVLREQGPWTDLYAIGCLAFTLVSGAPPFRVRDLRTLAIAHTTKPPPALQSRMDVPRGFEGWLHGLLAKRPVERFMFAADARFALEELTTDRMVPASLSPPTSFTPTPMTTPVGTDLLIEPLPAPNELSSVLPTLPERAPPPMPGHWRDERAATRLQHLHGVGLGIFGLRTIPLVDRDGERDAIWKALNHTSQFMEPRVVLLRGNAGTGKTRVATWMAERAHELGSAAVLRATHSAEGGNHDGVAAMFARHLRCTNMAPEAINEALRIELRALGDADQAFADALGELLAARKHAALMEGAAAGTAERCRIWRRLLDLLSTERALIVVLDDVHWGLEALRLVRHALDRSDDQHRFASIPVLFLLTVVDEALGAQPLEAVQLADLARDERVAVIEVNKLAPDDHHELIENMLGLSGELVDRVAARTGGNPLFAVQLIDDWVARSILVAGQHGLELREGASDELPDDLHALCSARITHALRGRADNDKRALELAALLGIEVDEAEWRAACAEAGLSPAPGMLDELARQGLLEPAFGSWRFSHGVIRESLERQARAAGRWRDNNRFVAVALRGGDIATAEVNARVGRHMIAAGELHEAYAPLMRAARILRVEGEFDRAHAMLDTREAVLDKLGAPRADPRRAESTLLDAQLCFDQKDYDRADDLAAEIELLARDQSWPALVARAQLRRGNVAVARSDWTAANERLSFALQTLKGYGDTRGEFEARNGLADVLYYMGNRDAAARAYLENLTLAQNTGDQLAIAESFWGLGYVRMWQDRLAEAQQHFVAMRDILIAHGAAYRLSDAYNALGETARLSKRFAEAERYYRESLRLNHVYGTRGALANRLNIIMVKLFQDDITAAETLLPSLIGDATRSESRNVLAGALPIALICHARAHTWQAWEMTFSKLEALIADSGFKDGDVATALELAARHCDEQSDGARAARVRALAIAQWSALGRADRVAALQSS